MVLLDTDVLVDTLRGIPSAQAWLIATPKEPFGMFRESSRWNCFTLYIQCETLRSGPRAACPAAVRPSLTLATPMADPVPRSPVESAGPASGGSAAGPLSRQLVRAPEGPCSATDGRRDSACRQNSRRKS